MKGLVWWAVLIISHSWETSFFSSQAWNSFSWDTWWPIAPVWRGWGACFLCSLSLWSLLNHPYRIPILGLEPWLWGSVHGTAVQSPGWFSLILRGCYKPTFTWPQESPGLSWQEHPAPHTPERGAAPCQGWPRGQGCDKAGHCLACTHMELQCSVLQSQSARAQIFTKNTRVKFCPQLPACSSH